MQILKVGQNDVGKRLDCFLLSCMPNLPKSLICKLIRKKKIKINDKKSEINYRLFLGDIIKIYLKKELIEFKNINTNFLKLNNILNKKLNIIYEDKNILIINKPYGLVCHLDKSKKIDCLINRIKKYLYDKNEFDIKNENIFSPALANRIDRNTEGIVLAAKNLQSLKELNEKIKNREIKKYYKCLVYGRPVKNEEIITGFLVKNSEKNKVFISKNKSENSRFIKTRYKLEKYYNKKNISLLKIELLTGRSHQIRAHLASIGLPIIGDKKYGEFKINKNINKNINQKLVAYKIKFEFKTPAKILNYLNNQEFEISKSELLQDFF